MSKRAWESIAAEWHASLLSAGHATASVVSQLGSRDRYPAEPRWDREIELSVIQGDPLSVEDAVKVTFHRKARPVDCIRDLSVDHLREAGHEVRDTATPRSPRHASISAPADLSPDEMKTWWADPSRVTLDEIAGQTDNRKG